MEFLDSAWFQIMSMMRDENTEDWSIWASNAAMKWSNTNVRLPLLPANKGTTVYLQLVQEQFPTPLAKKTDLIRLLYLLLSKVSSVEEDLQMSASGQTMTFPATSDWLANKLYLILNDANHS